MLVVLEIFKTFYVTVWMSQVCILNTMGLAIELGQIMHIGEKKSSRTVVQYVLKGFLKFDRLSTPGYTLQDYHLIGVILREWSTVVTSFTC